MYLKNILKIIEKRISKSQIIGYGILILLLILFIYNADFERLQDKMFKTSLIVEQFPLIITQAARNTLIFTFLGFSGGIILGLIIALMRLSNLTLYRWLAIVYIDMLRGLPALLVLIFIAFGLPIALGIRIPGTYTRGSLALAIVSSAYIAEVLRAGIQAIPIGQEEAAKALGMKEFDVMQKVIFPQAFRIVLPPLTNELVLLLKDTALISVIGVTPETKELTRFGRDGVNWSANATPLVVAGFVYLAITIPMTRVANWLENKMSTPK
tara:strand:- start:395 stop:1198 length:804 start_codon:yes stop_codon:yes gene_type:complete